MQIIPILLVGLLVTLTGLIAWGAWTIARVRSEEGVVGQHQDLLLGLLLFAVFGLGVWVTFLLVALTR